MSAPEPSLADVVYGVLMVNHRASGYMRNFKSRKMEEYSEFNGSMRELADKIAEALRPGESQKPIGEV